MHTFFFLNQLVFIREVFLVICDRGTSGKAGSKQPSRIEGSIHAQRADSMVQSQYFDFVKHVTRIYGDIVAFLNWFVEYILSVLLD